MKLVDWEGWALDFWKLLAQHMSVAITTWLGVGVVDGQVQWRSLWFALLIGAFFPALAKFLGSSPTPKDPPSTN